MVPIRSAGRRSGVNWIREKLALMIWERVRTARVLARPGTPSSRMWPPVSIPTSRRSTMASCPTIRRDTSFTMRWTGRDSAGLSFSFGALTCAALERRGSVIPTIRNGPIRVPVSLLLRRHLDGPVEPRLLRWRERPGAARRQIPQPDRAVGEPGQSVHLESHRLRPPADDPVAPLAQGHVQDTPALRAGPHPDR